MFAYLTHHITEDYLAAQYRLDPIHLKVIVRNGAVLVAVFWAFHHVHLRPMDEVWTSHTPSQLANSFNREVYVLISDCFEEHLPCPSHLVLNHMAYSKKYKKPGYYKLLLLCFANGLIGARSPLFGGRASEMAPLHWLQQHLDRLAQLGIRYPMLYFVDRGFQTLRARLNDQQVAVFLPTFLAQRDKFPAGEVVMNQVLISSVYLCVRI